MSNRIDVQSALDILYNNNTSPEALRIVRNYVDTLEQQARNVVSDADDSHKIGTKGLARVTWTSINALRATINYPRR